MPFSSAVHILINATINTRYNLRLCNDLTLQKGISTILVVSGILLYSTSAPAKKHSPDIEEEAALK